MVATHNLNILNGNTLELTVSPHDESPLTSLLDKELFFPGIVKAENVGDISPQFEFFCRETGWTFFIKLGLDYSDEGFYVFDNFEHHFRHRGPGRNVGILLNTEELGYATIRYHQELFQVVADLEESARIYEVYWQSSKDRVRQYLEVIDSVAGSNSTSIREILDRNMERLKQPKDYALPFARTMERYHYQAEVELVTEYALLAVLVNLYTRDKLSAMRLQKETGVGTPAELVAHATDYMNQHKSTG